MFLLSHKKWHTGKAENIARVRADEAAHAAEVAAAQQHTRSVVCTHTAHVEARGS